MDAVNLFGHGAPGESTALNIDVQFNLPVTTFSRTTGGAFLADIRTGKVLLAHRGIVTLGHGRVAKDALIQEMTCTLCEAETSNGTREFLVVAELDSPSLVTDIIAFATELRGSARALGAKSGGESKAPRAAKRSSGARAYKGTFGKLRKYFDEVTGERNVKGRRRAVIADCYHGSVVRALRDSLGVTDQALKSREIDLVALTKKTVFIIEVGSSPKRSLTISCQFRILPGTLSPPRCGRGRAPDRRRRDLPRLPGRTSGHRPPEYRPSPDLPAESGPAESANP